MHEFPSIIGIDMNAIYKERLQVFDHNNGLNTSGLVNDKKDIEIEALLIPALAGKYESAVYVFK